MKLWKKLKSQTSNVIYELHCKKDSLAYIGETFKTAETRFVGHLNTILQDCHSNTSTPVDQNFRSAGHSHTDIKVTPIEKITSKNHFVRNAREAFHTRFRSGICHLERWTNFLIQNLPKSAESKETTYLSGGAQSSGNSNRMYLCFSENQILSMKISEQKRSSLSVNPKCVK